MASPGLKTNTDEDKPGKDRESNWLPSDKNSFNVILRMYLPAAEVLNGIWTLSPITPQ